MGKDDDQKSSSEHADAKLISLRSQRTVFERHITTIRQKVDLEGKKEDANVLECRLQILESHYRQLCQIQTQIENLHSIDTCRAELDENFIMTKVKITSLIQSKQRPSILDTSLNESAMQQGGAYHSRLPKIKLPTFDGKYADYKRFSKLFDSLVHKDAAITKMDKFNYLLGCLAGPALEVVQSFQVTEENYDKAVERLKARYDNDVLIFLECISSFFALPSLSLADPLELQRLVDKASALRGSLLSLGEEQQVMDNVMIHVLLSKVDTQTKMKYNEQQTFEKLPSWDECCVTLNRRCQFLESQLSSNRPAENKDLRHKAKQQTGTKSFVTTNADCLYCNATTHFISSCKAFADLSLQHRADHVKKAGACFNCLRKAHQVKDCQSQSRCKICRLQHHTLLHKFKSQPNPSLHISSNQPNSQNESNGFQGLPVSGQMTQPRVTLMARTIKKGIIPTAVVQIRDKFGQFHIVRALLDSCSEVSFITEETAKRLQLEKIRVHQEVSGISDLRQKIHHNVFATLKSRHSSFEWSSNFSIIKTICAKQPDETQITPKWNLPNDIILADPHFYVSSKIDVLINTEGFFEAVREGKLSLGGNMPCLLNTEYGWIVGGNMGQTSPVRVRQCNVVQESHSLEQLVQQFWEIEDCKIIENVRTVEEQACEEHFCKTVSTQKDGRIQVRLPFKESPNELGNSFETAHKRFISVEKRLSRNEQLKRAYIDFMDEYISLGHMALAANVDHNKPHFYIPHHCVLRPESLSTKLRVVYDGSAKTTSGKSLNDLLMVGSTIQQDLITTLLSFRLNKFALTGDIAKMYRQFTIHEEDRKFQLILWRSDPNSDLQTYQLNTVTYGTSAAPHLAIRALQHIAEIHEVEYPIGASVLRSDLYVDDVLTGADKVEDLQQKKDQLVRILTKAGLQLTKFSSNSKEIVATSANEVFIELNDQEFTKTLGIAWQPNADVFVFRYQIEDAEIVTRRSVLSVIARIFDLLGLISPIVIRGKIFLQDLTLKKLHWDAPIDGQELCTWKELLEDIRELSNVRIPRFVSTSTSFPCEIHGYADASERAYGCCIYVRTQMKNDVAVNLLVAKSKVAPIRVKSLPKLELCAALLLSRTWRKFAHKLHSYTNIVYFWTDSKIVLQWMTMHASQLQCFVANRISELQEHNQNITWKHVPSAHNPADIVSRGCRSADLLTNMWLRGPEFLKEPLEKWPELREPLPTPIEVRSRAALPCKSQEMSVLESVINKNSSYIRVLRIIAYVYRATNQSKPNSQLQVKDVLHIPAQEVERTFWKIIAHIQRLSYLPEIHALRKGKSLQPRMQCLTPFLQEISDGNSTVCVMRVGGRLTNSNLPFDAKFPAILPKHHRFVQLYIEFLHRSNHHAGPKVLLALLRQKIWVINAREAVRQIVRRCTLCFHYKPQLMNQIMGNLPVDRLRENRPFLVSGVDFCGPFFTSYKIRGKPPYKTYVAIFVCFTSKAIHIELVTELSSMAFLLCVRRFIARRGVPLKLYCDNGTNFVGAAAKLKDLKDQMLSDVSINFLNSYSTCKGFDFCFIPPRAPHFGGIWEAAVKSAKTLALKTISNENLTFEELQTVFTEVEAILNSRPIAPASDDPNDAEAVTPAHLLIGSSLTAAPDERHYNPDDDKGRRYLDRWQRVAYLKQQFWCLWHRDYIHTLQQRTKWSKKQPNLEVGQLVIIHEDNLPPQQWLLARVVAVITGKDGQVRVADVKTSKGILRRPVHKLALLPMNDG